MSDAAPALYPYARSADQDARTPARHPVVVAGAGPVGLAVAIDLALHGVPVVVLDDNDRVSAGSRAICWAKRPLEILDRLGCGAPCVAEGVGWRTGRVLLGDREIYAFDLLPEEGHRRPAFVNLQQSRVEEILVARLQALAAAGCPVDLRGCNRVAAIDARGDGVGLAVETPEGSYGLEADWLVACDGAGSPVRGMLGQGFRGEVFEDNFLIADVEMLSDMPAERRFWFDPPFNPGRSALLHRQPGNIWRIDLQLGRDIDRAAERAPERVTARLRAMLGPDARFRLDWVSIYTFQCRRMERFRHGRVIFAGDSAHQVSPFGARGANGGLQDADNLVWKLALVLAGQAPEALLDSYDAERGQAADENITASTRSTAFITPATPASRRYRDAVLALAARHPFARPLVNSGRLSVPSVYDASPLNGPDALPGAPPRSRPGAPCPDARLDNGHLLDRLRGGFRLMTLDAEAPESVEAAGVPIARLALRCADDPSGGLAARYLGTAATAVYLLRPDQHVVARWPAFDAAAVAAALAGATGRRPWAA